MYVGRPLSLTSYADVRCPLWQGLFLQKTNIIRDYLEDYADGRAFWPQQAYAYLWLCWDLEGVVCSSASLCDEQMGRVSADCAGCQAHLNRRESDCTAPANLPTPSGCCLPLMERG